MKAYRMVLAAAFVLTADFGAVVVIVGSLWLEQWFGWNRGLILDVVVLGAVSYGVAAWIAGKFLQWELKESPDSRAARSGAGAHPREIHSAP